LKPIRREDTAVSKGHRISISHEPAPDSVGNARCRKREAIRFETERKKHHVLAMRYIE